MERKREFEKNSILLFIMMMGANVCNYLFQIIMGRMIDVADYGILNSLLSVITIFSVPATIIMMITARYVSMGKAVNDRGRVKTAFYTLAKATAGLIIILFCGGMAISVGLKGFLKIENMLYIPLCISVACVVLLNAPLSGTLQGLQRFTGFGMQTFLPAFFKLVLSMLLVGLGFEIFGVLVSLLLGNVITVCYCGMLVREEMKGVFYDGEDGLKFADFKQYVSGTIIAQLCVVVASNYDILLVKSFFSERTAGIYSSGMVIGKIAMYISNAVVATLFPIVAEKYEKGEKTKPIFGKALFYGGGTALLCSISMITFGQGIVGILFGTRYMQAIHLLPAICSYIIPVTFLTIIMNYVLARGETRLFSFSMAVGITGSLLAALLLRRSVHTMLFAMGGVMSVVALYNITVIFSRKEKVLLGINGEEE